MKAINVMNVPDFKRSDGSWGKFYTDYDGEQRLQMHTRACVLWNNMVNRSREDSAQRKNNTSYVQVENHFESYDMFTDWCQDQYGYLNKNPHGTFWSLDKDILVPGNRIYSPDTCMFVPLSVNNVLLGSDKTRGDDPIGAKLHVQGNCVKYMASCRQRTGTSYIGVFLTPEEAHAAWQLAKIERLWEEALDVTDHTKLYSALMVHIERIQNDYDNGRETKVEWWTTRGLTIH